MNIGKYTGSLKFFFRRQIVRHNRSSATVVTLRLMAAGALRLPWK